MTSIPSSLSRLESCFERKTDSLLSRCSTADAKIKTVHFAQQCDLTRNLEVSPLGLACFRPLESSTSKLSLGSAFSIEQELSVPG